MCVYVCDVCMQRDGTTPLAVAAEEGHLEVARALLTAKADVEATSTDGFTPLMRAIERQESQHQKDVTAEMTELLVMHKVRTYVRTVARTTVRVHACTVQPATHALVVHGLTDRQRADSPLPLSSPTYI